MYIASMYKELTGGYLTVKNFAKTYRSKSGKLGVSPRYIYQLIEKEIAEPDSTNLDIISIDGSYFCKLIQR